MEIIREVTTEQARRIDEMISLDAKIEEGNRKKSMVVLSMQDILNCMISPNFSEKTVIVDQRKLIELWKNRLGIL